MSARVGRLEDTMATKVRNTHFLITLIATWINSLIRTVTGGAAGGAVSGTSASTTPAFTGTAPTTMSTNVATGTGYSTAGQVVTTSDNQTAPLNSLAGCWLLTATHAPCQIVSHPPAVAAPLVLTVFGAAPPTTAEDYKIVRAPTPAGAVAAHTHGAGSFAADPASGAVHFDRGEYTVIAANATTLGTSLALTKALLTAYSTHINDALGHLVADDTNVPTYAVADVVDLASAILVANELKGLYNTHRAQAGVHPNDDSGHATAASDATDQSSLNTLVNELKGDFNAHIADGFATPSWRVEAA